MTIIKLKTHLKTANHSAESRRLHSRFILENKSLFPELFTIAQETDNAISYKATWVLEFIVEII